MEQVAKIGNVGKGTIYTFFSNNEELFNAIALQMIDEMRRVSEAATVKGALETFLIFFRLTVK